MKQETNRAAKYYTNKHSISNSNKDKLTVNNQLSNTVGYFLPWQNYDSDKKKSAEITEQLQRDFEDVFNGIGCFDDTFSLKLKLDSKPYHAPLRHVAYMLQKHFEEELKRLEKQHIISPLGLDKTAEWCNSFVLVPKANGKVRLCLDPTQLNQALIRPVHREPTLSDILPKLNNVNIFLLQMQLQGITT